MFLWRKKQTHIQNLCRERGKFPPRARLVLWQSTELSKLHSENSWIYFKLQSSDWRETEQSWWTKVRQQSVILVLHVPTELLKKDQNNSKLKIPRQNVNDGNCCGNNHNYRYCSITRNFLNAWSNVVHSYLSKQYETSKSSKKVSKWQF